MSGNTILSWNLLHLRPPGSVSKIIIYSVYSEQVSSKRYFCYSNIPVKSVKTEQSSIPACLGPRHGCVSCDTPKALVPLETTKEVQSQVAIEWTLPYLITYIKNMFILYMAAATRKMAMCAKITSDPHTLESVENDDGIDMTPARPKKKENPTPQEIPDPGMPENLPGCPIPGIPDVAIPIVPELPMPDMPEIPAPTPKAPGKVKGKPLPGDPIPILQDMLSERWPLPILCDVIRQRFPIPAFQDSTFKFVSPFIHCPLERNKIVLNIMRTNIRRLSTPRNDPERKILISKGLYVPEMVKDLLKNNKIFVPKDEMIHTLAKLTPAELQATFNLLKIHRQKMKDTEDISNEIIFGMSFKQFQELVTYVTRLKKLEKPSKRLGSKLYTPSQRFIRNAKFLAPIQEEQYFKGIFPGKIQIKDRKYFKRF